MQKYDQIDKGVTPLTIVIDSIKMLLTRGQQTTVQKKPRFTTLDDSMRKNEVEAKWQQLATIRKMYNGLLSDRNGKGENRFTILYYISRWSNIKSFQISQNAPLTINHTLGSLIDEITWLDEQEIYQCVKDLCRLHWLEHKDGHLRLTSLGIIHFEQLLVTEAEDFSNDFLLTQMLNDFEKRNLLGTTNQSTITSFGIALKILDDTRIRLSRILNNFEPSAINAASANVEAYLDQMRRFRSRIIDVGILEEDDPMVRFCYHLLGEVGNLIQDIRKIKDRQDAVLRGQQVIQYEPAELDRVIAIMLNKPSIEKTIDELCKWVNDPTVNDLPLILDTGSLIPALEAVHELTMAMNKNEEEEQENSQPTTREQQVSFKTAMDYFLENLQEQLLTGSTLTASEIIPHELKGQTLLNLSRIKWLSGNSIDIQRKYGGPLLKYTPLGIKTAVPKFQIEYMDDAKIALEKESSTDE